MLKLRNIKEAGFTLIEILIALGIAGAIGTGAAAVIQNLYGSNRASQDMQAINKIENVAFWMNQDVWTTQTVTPGPGSGFPLNLASIDWDGVETIITYDFIGSSLHRSLSRRRKRPSTNGRKFTRLF